MIKTIAHSFDNIIVFCIVFLFSLESFYNFKYSINFFYIVGYFLSGIFFFYNILKNSENIFQILKSNKIILFYFYCFLSSLVSLFFLSQNLQLIFFLKFLFILTLSIFIVSTFKSKNFINIIALVLFIHLIFFYSQFLLYYILNLPFDFLNFFIGVEQVGHHQGGVKTSDLLSYIRLPRFAGLFNEPGTYANVILLFISIILLSKEKNDYFIYIISLAILSVILSGSLRGIVFVFIIILYIIISYKDFFLQIKNNKIFFSTIILISLWFCYNYLFKYLYVRFFGFFADFFSFRIDQSILEYYYTYSSINKYFEVLKYYFSRIDDPLFILFGIGIAAESKNLIIPIAFETGWLLYTLSRFGILSLILFLFLVRRVFFKFILLFSILFFGKLSFFSLSIFLFASFAIFINYEKK